MDDQTAITKIKSDLTWLQKHERLILAVLVIAAILVLGNKYLDRSAMIADQRVIAIQQQLVAQQNVNDTLDKRAKEQDARYQAIIDTMARQNAALAGAISNRDANLAKKQEAVKNMPLDQVAREWEQTINAPAGVLSVSGVSVSVPEPQARQTVTELQRVPVLVADLSDQVQINKNLTTVNDQCNQVVTTTKEQVVELNKTLTLQQNACKLEVDQVKKDARKGKRNGFIAGFISGIATRLFLKF